MSYEYTLFGSYASYYTAKTRSYLRKKGIPFVERLPSHPLFRETVSAASGSVRIPQLLTPEGGVVQDSVEILDYLEGRFPELPAIPTTPRQRIFVHLMELLGSEGLVRLAWMHRWLFKENLSFVKMDFGRSFRPQGSDEELLKYGNLIADRMMSRGLPESTEALRSHLDEQYLELLRHMETHLQTHPYLLGGHPSAADYSIMGAMHAHLGRDPAGLRTMQNNAPRVFRWVEHMIVPEVQSPEFYDCAIEYPADDRVPETALAVLRFIAENTGRPFVLGALAFNVAVERIGPEQGYQFNEDLDQPVLEVESVRYRDETQEGQANLYAIWILQRAQKHFQSLTIEARNDVLRMLGDGIARDLIQVPLTTVLERINNRLLAGR